MRNFWPNQHNTYKNNKRTSIFAAGFVPETIKQFRTYPLDCADTGTGRWLLCYWTVTQSCYQEKFYKFIINFIELVVSFKLELEISGQA